MKSCSLCKQKLSLKQFQTNAIGTFGRQSACKECRKKYVRTKYQVARTQYSKMQTPEMTLDELLWWLHHKTNFNLYHALWKKEGYPTSLRPRIRRIDTKKPYSLENLQVLNTGK